MAICNIEDVYKVYDKKRVLESVNLNIDQGKVSCLVGPSGCGKTTLVNLIAGYEFPDKGEVLFNGEKVKGPGDNRLVIFQETALFNWLNLWENILWGPLSRTRNLKNLDEPIKKTQWWIERVGLKGFEEKYPLQLSGGMQRRAELIRGLVNEPLLLLMDEPFRGLDAMTRQLMQEYVNGLFEEIKHTTIFFITTDIQEAIFMSDKIYFMSVTPGRIVKEMVIDLPRPRKLEYTWRIIHKSVVLSFPPVQVIAHFAGSYFSKTSRTTCFDFSINSAFFSFVFLFILILLFYFFSPLFIRGFNLLFITSTCGKISTMLFISCGSSTRLYTSHISSPLSPSWYIILKFSSR
ncbi:Vitamin B12 import ATP-binding protein BtuD [subsurface metagenome]